MSQRSLGNIPAIYDGPHAPVIFFDNAPTFGAYSGVFALTLCVALARAGSEGSVVNQGTVAAYLRTNRQGLLALRDSIDRALLLAEPVGKEQN